MRVGQQVDENLPQARGIAADGLRHAVGDFVQQVEALFRRPGRQQVERALDAFAQEKASCSSSRRPDSILEKSRMSLMMVSSVSPLARIVSA